jgi:hypothetical protein
MAYKKPTFYIQGGSEGFADRWTEEEKKWYA